MKTFLPPNQRQHVQPLSLDSHSPEQKLLRKKTKRVTLGLLHALCRAEHCRDMYRTLHALCPEQAESSPAIVDLDVLPSGTPRTG